MSERPQFQRQQYDFAAHIRDPDANPAPAEIEDRRMAIYRDLFYNNVQSLLAGTFPVLRKILPDPQWHALMRDYFSRHRATTPLFLEMPQEFIAYLQEERGEHPDDPPFMLELAHYEWAELALQIIEDDPDLASVDRDGDLLEGIPVISPTAWSLAYSFPVHTIRVDQQPDEPGEQPTFLIVYRNLEDEVGFLEINGVTARLFELLDRDESRTGRDVLGQIAEEIQHPDPDAVIEGGREILAGLRQHDVVLGTRVAAAPENQSPP